MRNIMVVMEYDGTNFHGFQRQDGLRTVQSELEDKLAIVTKAKTRVIGAGRTDAGVHALAQVANFRTESRMEADRFVPALNSLFDPDLRIKAAREVSPEFHARYSATSKIYRYVMRVGGYPSVFLRNYVWHIPQALDIGEMEKASRHLVGRHDFRSFCAAGSGARNFVREVKRLEWASRGSLVFMEVEADGFLYHMVRTMVGTLVLVGKGDIPPDEAGRILHARDRKVAAATAPARGLWLVGVRY